jgi:hypothetical protein
MFYSLTLERELELAPRFFGPRMREVLQQKLVSEVRCGLAVGLGGIVWPRCCASPALLVPSVARR